MTNTEIRKLIDSNNSKIIDLIDPTEFVLNNKIRELMQANKELQKQCNHQFEDRRCKFCDAFKE